MIKQKQSYRNCIVMLVLLMGLSPQIQAQSGFVAAGIELGGASGSLSASVGQTFDMLTSGPDATISEGVHQLYPGTFRWQLPITGPETDERNNYFSFKNLPSNDQIVAIGCHSPRQYL